jgi:hypothetical protein
VPFDPDAQAFITAAVITDSTQQNAINQLVLDMKTANIWTKMKAVYPFIGGTATSHKWNLKDPRDLDAAFRLTFSGGWTHSATGILANGLNSFANTFLTRSAFSIINLGCQGLYLTAQNGSDIRYECGISATGQFFNMRSDDLASNNNWFNGGTTPKASSGVLRAVGFTASSRIAPNDYKTIIQNGTIISNTANDTTPYTTSTFHLGRANSASGWSNREFRFYFISDPLSSTELTNLRTSVIAFQTTLSRNV